MPLHFPVSLSPPPSAVPASHTPSPPLPIWCPPGSSPFLLPSSSAPYSCSACSFHSPTGCVCLCLALWVPMFPSAPISWSAFDLGIWPPESAGFSRIALPFFLQQPRSHQLRLWERIMVWMWPMCPFLHCPAGWSTRRAYRQSWGHVRAGGGLQQDRNAEGCWAPAVAAPGPQLCPCL